MNVSTMHLKAVAIAAVLTAAFPLTASAADSADALQPQINALQNQLDELRSQMQQQDKAVTTNPELAKEVQLLKQEVKSAAEWKQTNTKINFAGYADVGYADSKNATGTFSPFNFNPIIQFMYKDLILLETELAYTIDETGESETEVEYAALSLFLNDYMALSAGKFLSPIGQFRQNGHPSWINKLASAPVGFGHGQAAPIAEVGVQLRGGIPLAGGDNRVNYAVFLGNGPELEIMGDEIEMIETPGVGRDRDGSKVGGGRVGLFLPAYKLDLGLSAATGKVAGMEETGIKRDYDVLGADFTWRPAQFDFRGEYVEQKVGEASASASPEAGKWSAWYLQAAYRINKTKWEPVVRYSRMSTPHAGQDQKQWAVGMNYQIASNVVAKATYEFNDGLTGETTDTDRALVQLSYGF